MNLKNVEIYSNDQWLLARLTTDLQMSGLEFYSVLNDSPFDDDYYWLIVYNDGQFSIYDFPDREITTVYGLTSRNYIEVLTKILRTMRHSSEMLYDREMVVGYNVKTHSGQLVECHGFHEVGQSCDVELTSVEIVIAGKGVDILPMLNEKQKEEIINDLNLNE